MGGGAVAAAAAAGAAGAGAAEVVCGAAGAASSRDGAFAGAGAGCAAFRDDASMLGAPLVEAIGVTRTGAFRIGPSLRGVCQLDGGTLGLQRGSPETAQEPHVKANAINNALSAGQRLVR